MNSFLKNALAARKKLIDETSSTSAMGQGFGSLPSDKPTTSKLPFYTGDMVDKSRTGFTGLLNQGSTCYLNSLIQSLFMTPELRQAVFEWRYDSARDPEEKRCIPLQLQKLFAKLQTSIKGAIHTKGLTTSFGWTRREVFQQHDVLELSNVLFESLETQAYGSKLAMVVSDLHRGSYKDYVQCLKCQTLRGRDIAFVGLGLDITTAASFDEAMKQYITPEILDGGNKVNCNKCDAKQDSKKGIRLTTLPYFLGIHLKRWTFSLATLQRIKLTKKISFPEKFDGAEFLNCHGDGTKFADNDNENADDTPLEYELYSMMIHTGGAMGGHYFAYIKDFESQQWLQFNDSNVKSIADTDIDKWFNPPPEPEQKEQKEQKEQDKNDKKVTAAPIPKATEEKSPLPTTEGMDISAAIAANLKDKQEKKDLKTKLAQSKANRSEFLHPFGAAYMLMYRLIDPTRNVIRVSDESIPTDIMDEIKKEDEIYKKQKDEYDHLRQFTTLKIHYDGKVTDVMVKKKEPLQIAMETVYGALDLHDLYGVADITCMRLRNMKVLHNIPLQPYELEADGAELIEHFEFHDPKHLILETKKFEETFRQYEKEKISLRVIELNEHKMEWKASVLVQVDEGSLIGALREAICEQIGCEEVERIRMAYLKEGLALLLSDDSKRIKKDEGILNGHYIHFEVCQRGGKHSEGKSKLMDKFDKQLNTLHLLYNELEFDETKEDIFTLSIDVDVRTELGKLREMLADKLNVNVNELVIRMGFHQQELKNNNKTLEEYKLHANQHVFVARGTPLTPTQYLFQIFIEDAVYIQKRKEQEKRKWDEYLQQELEKEKENKEEKQEPKKTIKSGVDESLGAAFLFVGDCVLDCNWTLQKVKETICGSVANVPSANAMRLRSFNDHNRLLKVYLDSLTLGGNLNRSIKDYTQICCQKTATANESFTKDKILLYIARWYPQRMDFGQQIEYAFDKKTKIKSELRLELSKYSGIPVEYIRCEHPRAYLLKNVENRRKVCILDWENANCTDHNTLTGKQWKCKNGEFILYKDCREKERLTKEDFETGSITSIIPRQEEALIFYSPQQQIQREKQEELAAEEREKQQQQAQSDAIERMKESSQLTAKAAQQSMQKSLAK